MEKAATAIAEALSLPLTVARCSVEPWSETAARSARYGLLMAELAGAETVLTGHTADDQAETILANILRGTGPIGLTGIPARRGRIARPLLKIWRSETREFAALAGLPWADDPTNEEPHTIRNRLRLGLLPQLEAEYNPAVKSALVGLGELSQPAKAQNDPGEALVDGWRVPNSFLWALGRESAALILRAALRPWRGGYGLDRAETQRIWEVVTGARSRVELQGGLSVSRSGSWLVCRSLPLRLSEDD
jgi:tRNA(Ile)-lysidine synthase